MRLFHNVYAVNTLVEQFHSKT